MTNQHFDPKFNDQHAFAVILMSAYPPNQMVSPEEMDWAMQWFRKGDILADENRNREGWWRDLRSLGLIQGNQLDRPRLKKVSEYIWSHTDKTPSFAALQEWLKPQDEAQKRQVSAKLKSLKKRKKMQRKQRKLSRKRR